jgi:hypothetical protein
MDIDLRGGCAGLPVGLHGEFTGYNNGPTMQVGLWITNDGEHYSMAWHHALNYGPAGLAHRLLHILADSLHNRPGSAAAQVYDLFQKGIYRKEEIDWVQIAHALIGDEDRRRRVKFYALQWPAWKADPDIVGDEPSFDEPRQAWAWLMEARRQQEDQFPDWNGGEYTETVRDLDYAAGTEVYGAGACEFGNPHEDWPLSPDGTGSIRASTPGLGDHAFEDGILEPGVMYAVVAR